MILKKSLLKRYKIWNKKNSKHVFITDTNDILLYYWDWDNHPKVWRPSTWAPDKTINDLPGGYSDEESYDIKLISKKELFIEIL